MQKLAFAGHLRSSPFEGKMALPFCGGQVRQNEKKKRQHFFLGVQTMKLGEWSNFVCLSLSLVYFTQARAFPSETLIHRDANIHATTNLTVPLHHRFSPHYLPALYLLCPHPHLHLSFNSCALRECN
ncbi:hypothetical protein, unlikely [Trypanosoma brucei gambiense DAL972]|uniref:Uncharacterized protein n=1 Tax=Trypanosoma brucei gambiense (strain MHOM/CI/86/DAL972) TaxID=679716 RepID=C9ZV15_TRYB9|nr:hypothetical protein, unlikely [Trypanosoma brucei gambiense DAL972]CBH13253.1 hypothetical protein, unlikely [Trypanosoma brucei gambiense DAL972]|eukprot:XP_011775530.1 hypothetical protein, unlikely [Trypanosoma brucei gambiense DAL972]